MRPSLTLWMPFPHATDSTRRLNILIAQVQSNSDADISKE